MPLKLTGALLLSLAGLGGGWLYVRRLSLRTDFLSAFLTFLSNLSTALRFRSEPIDALVNSSWELCKLPGADSGCSAAQSWKNAVADFPKRWRLNTGDMALLEAFGERLGTTDTQGQLEHIALYRAQFERRLEQARADMAQKAKLYKALGLFAGVSAALMLL